MNGAWDFAIHIATPEVRFHLGNPHEKVALEIGCGGGRLLAAASQYFRHVIGLDIHTRLDWVRKHLAGRGIQNCDVIRGDGASIPLPDESVDFVYSFIVLHHLQSFDAFTSYLRESRRCLKAGGLAQLYYGKNDRGVDEKAGYAANAISLSMSRDDAIRAACSSGFEVLAEGESWRFGEAQLRRGYQGSMLLRIGQ